MKFFAAALGALPECGTTISVVTQFIKRQARFGGLIVNLIHKKDVWGPKEKRHKL